MYPTVWGVCTGVSWNDAKRILNQNRYGSGESWFCCQLSKKLTFYSYVEYFHFSQRVWQVMWKHTNSFPFQHTENGLRGAKLALIFRSVDLNISLFWFFDSPCLPPRNFLCSMNSLFLHIFNRFMSTPLSLKLIAVSPSSSRKLQLNYYHSLTGINYRVYLWERTAFKTHLISRVSN